MKQAIKPKVHLFQVNFTDEEAAAFEKLGGGRYVRSMVRSTLRECKKLEEERKLQLFRIFVLRDPDLSKQFSHFCGLDQEVPDNE